MGVAVLAGAGAARAATVTPGPTDGIITSFSVTPSSTAAAGHPGVAIAASFNYPTSGDSVKDLVIALPPGLDLAIADVAATCSSAQLIANACPGGSLIGTGTDDVQLAGALPMSQSVSIYLMPPPVTSDLAGVGLVIKSPGGDAYVSNGGLALSVPDGATAPQFVIVIPSLPNTAAEPVSQAAPASITTVDLDLSATTPGGEPLTRMPASCAIADSTMFADSYDDEYGAAGSSFAPTGCPLPYTPTLSAMASRTSDGAGVLSLTLSDPAPLTQGTTDQLSLMMPAGFGLGSAPVTCSETDLLACPSGSEIATIAGTSPLFGSESLGGTLYLTPALASGDLFGLTAAIRTIGSTVLQNPIIATGAITAAGSRTVLTLTGLPDVPLAKLTLTMPGTVLASCSTNPTTVSGTAVQQPAETGSYASADPLSDPVSVTGCPASALPHQSANPKLFGVGLTGIGSGNPVLRFTLSGSQLTGFQLQLPSGLAFRRQDRSAVQVWARSATGSLVFPSLLLQSGPTHLLVRLKTPAVKLRVSFGPGVLTATKALVRQAHLRQIGALSFPVTPTVSGGKPATLNATVRRPR